MFVDQVQIEVEGGRGGNGACSFLRLRYVPRGGPDGGNGGRGGSVIVVAKAGVNSLVNVAHRKQWRAECGRHGQGGNRHGRGANDLIVEVPPGTVVSDANEDLILKDLASEGDQVTVARGGKGGRGNAVFKSSTNRAPREFTRGDPGEHRQVVLELKVIADVGLIGKPNAGKSTLLSRMTRARPEIAAYPFTTKYPNLGRVQVDFDNSFVMADIPGLIEGAHAGVGLGHEFLRHIQRAGVLVHLVEPQPMDGTDPVENYFSIRDELSQYDEGLGKRPEIVAVTKSELPGAGDVRDALAIAIPSRASGRDKVLLISAVTGEGLNHLNGAIQQELFQREAR